MSEGYVTAADGVRLFYRQLGSGPATTLVPDASFLFDHFAHLAGSERTLICFDVRNRGRSDVVSDRSRVARGIHQEADDLEAVRQHFGLNSMDLIGHSYWGVVVMLYAIQYGHVNRIVQIGPSQPDGSKIYPPELLWFDQISQDFATALANLQAQRHLRPAAELRGELMTWLRRLMVLNSADVPRLLWNVADLATEAAAFAHVNQAILPTLHALRLQRADMAQVAAPVLIIHGRKDRQAAYGGARDWAASLPDARLLTVEEAAHVPWIEAPELVFNAITTFLNGAWPADAEQVG